MSGGPYTLLAKFKIGDKVEIDGDRDHIGTIVRICFGPGTDYDVRTWRDGCEQQTWLAEFRLKAVLS